MQQKLRSPSPLCWQRRIFTGLAARSHFSSLFTASPWMLRSKSNTSLYTQHLNRWDYSIIFSNLVWRKQKVFTCMCLQTGGEAHCEKICQDQEWPHWGTVELYPRKRCQLHLTLKSWQSDWQTDLLNFWLVGRRFGWTLCALHCTAHVSFWRLANYNMHILIKEIKSNLDTCSEYN